MNSHKSGAMIFGLVVVCLLLLYVTIRYAKYITIGICTVLTAALAVPCAGLWIVLFLSVRLILLILSVLCVTGGRPFLKELSKGDYCRLCYKCEVIVKNSRLLRGSPWIPTLSSEKHDFYNRLELCESKSGCHMCRLLFYSVDSFKEPNDGSDSGINQPTQDRDTKSSNHAVTPNKSSAVHTDKVTLRIWMRRSLFEQPVLRIQLHGPSIVKSNPLEVKWQTKGESHFSHGVHRSVYVCRTFQDFGSG
jgi:hypothetical protein